MALRHLDEDGVGAAIAALILAQLRAKATGVGADDRVDAWIEVGATPEHIDAEDVFLQPAAAVREGMLDDITQETTEDRRIHERGAVQHALQLRFHLGSSRHVAIAWETVHAPPMVPVRLRV